MPLLFLVQFFIDVRVNYLPAHMLDYFHVRYFFLHLQYHPYTHFLSIGLIVNFFIHLFVLIRFIHDVVRTLVVQSTNAYAQVN